MGARTAGAARLPYCVFGIFDDVKRDEVCLSEGHLRVELEILALRDLTQEGVENLEF